ncbi:hypothetical protein KR50_30210 [Jeotgalibacillus campisalis]|uniref:Uncharacterized protein n=1 Tax=Jeotgalibacillus campisalis TaxID=220754 RepID=A0A0C2VPH0_9BACL|nr:hypothetical protein KR50_30210 [Jeotgalibacillus campisalis]
MVQDDKMTVNDKSRVRFLFYNKIKTQGGVNLWLVIQVLHGKSPVV